MEYPGEAQPHTDSMVITSDTYSRKCPSDDDDDFVNPPPVTMPIQKIVKKQTSIEKPRNMEDSLRCLNTRFPPEHITKTMALLNEDQQSIGFGSALNMQLEKLPCRICYWVVDNYNPTSNSIHLFYLNFTKVEDDTMQSPTAGMIHWTTDMLKRRELKELSKGGFGNVTISLQHMNMNHTKQDDNYKTEYGEDDDVVGSERYCISPDGFIGNVVQETSENDADNNFLKEIMREINFNFNAYHNAKRAIDKLLMRGIKKFPDSVEMCMLVTKINYEFNLAWPDFSTSDDSDDGTTSNGTTTPVMHYQQNTNATKDDQFQESTMVDDDDAVPDVVFFPVLENDHYYLTVFDFKKSECVIIDNIYSEESIEVIYGNVPNDLKILFTLYIDALNHPKRNSIKRAVKVRLSMGWMTKMNYIDCGVFIMRHMETYKGEDLDKWNVGLEPEFPDNDDQQMHLNELRKKYVTKILTSDLNLIKPSLHKKLASYDKLSDVEKENFNTEEHLQRIESRISLFY
ncbi:unnamed protein product [Lactuca virosa]|uniref:Ubiquitin-like protease family profile domain-containing protein n=1 Tax=Lactuca virosa TaxID=75947 RepID=A0AAU9N423_9ASTR|nr:unnamed protein product [Lactuca virosa]